MYLYLTSENVGGYHATNTGEDFVVTLPASYYFSRNEMWEIGLIDLYLQYPNTTVLNTLKSKKIIHVYSDCVDSSVYNGGERKLLTSTRLKDCIKSIYYPTHIRYSPLSQEWLSTIRVYLRYNNGEALSLEGLTSTCTLHIKRREPLM